MLSQSNGNEGLSNELSHDEADWNKARRQTNSVRLGIAEL